jgi:hypothetical protein
MSLGGTEPAMIDRNSIGVLPGQRGGSGGIRTHGPSRVSRFQDDPAHNALLTWTNAAYQAAQVAEL